MIEATEQRPGTWGETAVAFVIRYMQNEKYLPNDASFYCSVGPTLIRRPRTDSLLRSGA